VAVVRERLRAEAALRAEEARLRLALDAGRLGAWELDVATGAAAARSASHDAIFGYAEPPAEWGYETFMRHVLPEDRDGVDRSFRAAVEGGAEWHFECRVRRAGDGEARWIEARGRPVFDAEGRPVRLLGVVADVTERRLAKERRALLVAELNHRVKNTLAVVQSLAFQTARGARDLAAFSAAFQSRLVALARAHDLLMRAVRGWRLRRRGAL
jgi:PAS domain S-box-containing protein